MADDSLASLAADLGAVPKGASRNLRKAFEVTSRSIKDDWREGAEVSGSYASTYPDAISYDITASADGLRSVIGPVLGKTPGASAGFLEEGGGGVDGPPHHAGRNAVEANEADFERGIEIAITQALRAVGL